MYLRAGLPESTAIGEWAFIGCVEYGVQGKTWTWADAALVNLAKCLELTLNNGKNPDTREQLGPQTGEAAGPGGFREADGCLQRPALRTFQLCCSGRQRPSGGTQGTVGRNRMNQSWCRGQWKKELMLTTAAPFPTIRGVQFVGLATVSDSLTALKTFVYERKLLSLEEFTTMLREDFAGREVLRRTILNRTERFGTDKESSNSMAGTIFNLCCGAASGYRDIWGGIYTVSFYSLTAHVGLGKVVGATPDGRKAGEPLSDASSPSQYLKDGGITAVLSSQAKLPHHKAINGTLLNMKLNKSLISSTEGGRRLADLISAYFKMGGFHIQFNVVDPLMLKDARNIRKTIRTCLYG